MKAPSSSATRFVALPENPLASRHIYSLHDDIWMYYPIRLSSRRVGLTLQTPIKGTTAKLIDMVGGELAILKNINIAPAFIHCIGIWYIIQ